MNNALHQDLKDELDVLINASRYVAAQLGGRPASDVEIEKLVIAAYLKHTKSHH